VNCKKNSVQKLCVCPPFVDELLVEKERVRNLTAEIEQTVQEIQGS
jgi:hypothetical protein